MAVNLSKFEGVPATRKSGFEQHKEMVKKLKASNKSWDKGYLALRYRMSPSYYRPDIKEGLWENILMVKKPKGKYLKITRVR